VQFFSAFWEFIMRGGPAMLALLACSVLVVAIILERVVFLAQQRGDPDDLVRELGQRIAGGDIAGAIGLCDGKSGILPKVLKAGLLRASKSKIDIVDALSSTARRQLRRYEDNLSVLGTIAVIAPFVGLFGTVLGIIHAFDDIALKGNSTPAVVSAGVSEALITTAAGLFVAVTAVIFFNYFRNRSRVAREETLWAAEQLAELLDAKKNGTLKATDVSLLVDSGHPAGV
jgi:biopolymer transport protein ExbB